MIIDASKAIVLPGSKIRFMPFRYKKILKFEVVDIKKDILVLEDKTYGETTQCKKHRLLMDLKIGSTIDITCIRLKISKKIILTRIIRRLRSWNYRLHCLYDVYTHGEYITAQSDMHVYTGFWDKLDKQSRSPYRYKNYKKIDKFLEKLNKQL